MIESAQRQRERAEFDKFMARHVAKLTDHAKPYVGRLPPLEKELLLARALRTAWVRRESYTPGKENAGVLLWWEGCLRAAALSRPYWTQVYQDDVRRVSGKDLGT